MFPMCWMVAIEERGTKGPKDELRLNRGSCQYLKVMCLLSKNPSIQPFSFCLIVTYIESSPFSKSVLPNFCEFYVLL